MILYQLSMKYYVVLCAVMCAVLCPFITKAETFDFSADFIHEEGKTISTASDSFRVGIFPGAIDVDVHIRLENIEPHQVMLDNLPLNKEIISDVYVYDILATNPGEKVGTFDFKEAAITVEYDNEREYLNKGIYYWDNNKSTWIRLYSDKRRLTNTMSGWIHLPFARVAVLADKSGDVLYDGADFSYAHELPFDLSTEGYLLVSETDHQVLAARNIFDEYPVASLTKLMTALVIEESSYSFDDVLTYNPDRHYAYRNYLGLRRGEQVTVKDLYYSMLVGSLNVPTRMLVDITPYTEEVFINRMNGKAKELGLHNTNFHDTSGLSFRNRSTVYDIYRLFDEAYDNSAIRHGLGTKHYEFDEVYSSDDRIHHWFDNSNKLIDSSDDFQVLASKTGYTQEALSCLVMRFMKNGKEYTLVTLGNPDYVARFEEPERIVNSIDVPSFAVE